MPNRIRELREEKKVTQLQLSMEIGVTQETISAYEHNKHDPSIESLIKMSAYFGTSVDYIICNSDVKVQISEPQNSEEAKQRSRLLRYHQLLSAGGRERLLSYAAGLYDGGLL
ncbi:MAG: helix-turn-helix transcriptional regulator [Lachnospiraceae bacterium]|nr:helix-turn-helix transcriptional regulator [Lachnospiraceae bacterium]